MPSPPQSRAANVLLHPQEPSPGPASPHLTAPPGAQVPITVLDLLRSPGNGGGAQRRPGVTIAVGSQRAEIAPRTGIPAPFADQACSSLVSLHLLYRILAERMPDPCRRASLPPAGGHLSPLPALRAGAGAAVVLPPLWSLRAHVLAIA